MNSEDLEKVQAQKEALAVGQVYQLDSGFKRKSTGDKILLAGRYLGSSNGQEQFRIDGVYFQPDQLLYVSETSSCRSHRLIQTRSFDTEQFFKRVSPHLPSFPELERLKEQQSEVSKQLQSEENLEVLSWSFLNGGIDLGGELLAAPSEDRSFDLSRLDTSTAVPRRDADRGNRPFKTPTSKGEVKRDPSFRRKS